MGDPHLRALEAGEEDWGDGGGLGGGLGWPCSLAVLFWLRGGGEGHMDLPGVKRHAQKQMDRGLLWR